MNVFAKSCAETPGTDSAEVTKKLHELADQTLGFSQFT